MAVPVDPLTDIAALADPDAIELVVKDGVVVKDLTTAATTGVAAACRTA